MHDEFVGAKSRRRSSRAHDLCESEFASETGSDHSGFAPLTMRTKRRLASALQQWHNFFQEGEQSQMVGSIANRAITDLIREGSAEGLRNFLASRKSHVDDKDEVNAPQKMCI